MKDLASKKISELYNYSGVCPDCGEPGIPHLKKWAIAVVKESAKKEGINLTKKYWDVGKITFYAFGRFKLNWNSLDFIRGMMYFFEITKEDLK